MDIRVLRYFLAVAREESITKAAEQLHISQPPLSRQLKNLEEELGTQLLIRGSRKITLTEEGKLLRNRAEELIKLFEKTEAEVKMSDKYISGEIFICSGETEKFSLLAKTIRRIHNNYPDIKFRLSSSDSALVQDRLDKGLVDFGLLIEPVDMNKYDYIRFPFRDRWGLVVRRDDPLAIKERITVEDLKDLPLIVSNQINDSSEFYSFLSENLNQFNIVATYDLAFNATLLVREGIGYMITLDNLINTDENSGLIFRPFSPNLDAGICLVWKKHQILSKAASEFLKVFQEVLKDKDNIADISEYNL